MCPDRYVTDTKLPWAQTDPTPQIDPTATTVTAGSIATICAQGSTQYQNNQLIAKTISEAMTT